MKEVIRRIALVLGVIILIGLYIWFVVDTPANDSGDPILYTAGEVRCLGTVVGGPIYDSTEHVQKVTQWYYIQEDGNQDKFVTYGGINYPEGVPPTIGDPFCFSEAVESGVVPFYFIATTRESISGATTIIDGK